jgi:hypothetical protein
MTTVYCSRPDPENCRFPLRNQCVPSLHTTIHCGADTSTLVTLFSDALDSGHLSLTARGMVSAAYRPRIELQARTVADYRSHVCVQPTLKLA